MNKEQNGANHARDINNAMVTLCGLIVTPDFVRERGSVLTLPAQGLGPTQVRCPECREKMVRVGRWWRARRPAPGQRR